MKPLFCFALAATLGLPTAVHAVRPASAGATSPQPQDAQASTPPIAYRSAFDAYQYAPEEDATPDATWRAVNRKVGDAGGHMGHMGHMGDMAHMGQMQQTGQMHGHTMPMAKPAAAPAPAHHHEGH